MSEKQQDRFVPVLLLFFVPDSSDLCGSTDNSRLSVNLNPAGGARPASPMSCLKRLPETHHGSELELLSSFAPPAASHQIMQQDWQFVDGQQRKEADPLSVFRLKF
jgi:hypothetical protein